MILFEEVKLLVLEKNGCTYQAEVILQEISNVENNCILKINIPNNSIKVGSNNFFNCLCKIKEKYPNILIHCKGYKINVYPSRMTLQMSSGLMAYELKMGHSATRDDIVNIFDFDNSDLTSSNELQEGFYRKWLASL